LASGDPTVRKFDTWTGGLHEGWAIAPVPPWVRFGLVHALILRLQALLLPFKILVFSGH